MGKNIDGDDKNLRVLASVGLAIGGILGMAGTFAPTASLRGLAWGIDGIALVMATAILTLRYYREGRDMIAAGFLVFAIGEGAMLPSVAMDLAAGGPFFGAGAISWAVALALVSIPAFFPMAVRILGGIASILFAATALQIFMGIQLQAVSAPLPSYAYPFLVATMFGWIWTLMKRTSEK